MGNTRKSKKKKKNILFIVLGMIVALVVIVAICLYLYLNNIKKPYDVANTQQVSVTIPSGASTSQIAQILEENGIISNAFGFKLVSRLEKYDGKYKSGEYSIAPSMSTGEIILILVEGNSNTSRFTVPEGLTLEQTADKLAEKNLINKEAFLQQAETGSFDYKFMTMLPSGPKRLEGYLFPETYDIYTTANEYDMINRMLLQFDKVFTEEYYGKLKETGYTLNEIITIASMIERETMVDSERGMVASVIYNRLEIDMRLQIDATVQYALPEYKSRLYNEDLKIESPYNTYLNKGLPPGPICSPGAESIKAALYPEDTDYIFYVLSPDNDGKHRFSNSYEIFQKNKRDYLNSL